MGRTVLVGADEPVFVLETATSEGVTVVVGGEPEDVEATWWARAARERARKAFMVTAERGERIGGVDGWRE